MTVTEALDTLASWDHAVVSCAGATGVAQALGVNEEVPGHRMRSDPPGTFKGLTLTPEFEGKYQVDATTLACWLCEELNLTYRLFFGCGTQLRHCVSVLRTALLD